MLTADVSLSELRQSAMRLPDKERFAIALELQASIPDEYEADDDETLLLRPDVQEGIRAVEAILSGREAGLTEEEAEVELARLEAEVLTERARRFGHTEDFESDEERGGGCAELQ